MTDNQTNGRGQGSNQWHSVSGMGLYFSLILRPDLNITAIPPLTLSVGLAAAQTLTQTSGIHTQVKWPNDLILNDKKTGGILLEIVSKQAQINHLVIGIGININQSAGQFPPQLRQTATSLHTETGKTFERVNLLSQLLVNLEEIYFTFIDHGFTPFLPYFEQLDYLKGKTVAVKTQHKLLTGTAIGIDRTGALLIKSPDKSELKKVISGSVQIIGREKNAAGN